MYNKQEILDSVFREFNMAIWTYDIPKDKLSFDHKLCDLFGIIPKRHSGTLSWYKSHIHTDDTSQFDKEIDEAFKNKTPFESSFRVILPDGDTRHICSKTTIQCDAQGNVTSMSGICWEINIHKSDKSALQQNLQSEEKKWQVIVEKTSEISRIGAWEFKLKPKPELIWSRVTKEIHEVGYDYIPNLDTGINFYTAGKSREVITKVVNNAIEKGEPYDVELEIQTAKNRLKWVRAIGIPEQRNNKTVRLYGIFQDLTESKEVDRQLEYHSYLLENVSDAIISTNIDFEVLSWNRAAEKLYGWSVEEAIGRQVQDLIKQEFINPNENMDMANHELLEKGYYHNEVIHHSKDGKVLNIWCEVTMLKDDAGNQVGAVGVNHDITDRKKYENVILNSLSEKEVLLKEIHHRVKNNLQIVWGLLDIQQKRNINPEIKSALIDSKARIDTMALIHENLYQGKDLSHVDMGQYLNRLIGNIGSMYARSDRRVEILNNIKDVEFGLDITIPLALIINELITNAYKHAFNKKKQGTVSIDIVKKTNKFLLTIEDNGDGFSKGFDANDTNSLGIRLMHNLCRQLDGTISFESKVNIGSTIKLEFHDKY